MIRVPGTGAQSNRRRPANRTIVLRVIEPGWRTGKKKLSALSIFPSLRVASLDGQKARKHRPEDKMKRNRILALATLVVAATAVATPPKPESKVDASAAFSRLKGLAGEWNIESARGRGRSQFQVIAGGSVVLERFTEPGGGEMLTAYHLDGDRLVLTHYCMAGNQPHMVAEKFDAASGELNFAFAGGVNIGADTGHIDRKSTRLNSSHLGISYAVFCLK